MVVLEQEVRDLLDRPAATSVDANTITSNISRATIIVDGFAQTGSSTVNVDHAIRATAVWLSYGSYMEGISMQMGAMAVADQVKLDHLRTVAELFINQISGTFVDLNASNEKQELQGIDPTAYTLSTTEAYRQS